MSVIIQNTPGATIRDLARMPGQPRIVALAEPHTPEWHDARRGGLGGSDVAAALGMDDWRSPYEVWADKRGLAGLRETSEPAEWGQRLEPIVAEWAAERLGAVLVESPGVLAHREHGWARANVDRFLRMPDDSVAILECKVTSLSDGWKGDDLPARVEVQARWYLAITGLSVCHVAAVLNGRQGVLRRVVRDVDLERWLLAQAERFWQRVLNDDPPAPGASSRVTDLLNAVRSTEATVDLDAGWRDALREHARLKLNLDVAQQALDAWENQLRATLGDAERAYLDGEKVVTYRTQVARRIDTARLRADLPDVAEAYSTESVSRPLRVHGLKEGDA